MSLFHKREKVGERKKERKKDRKEKKRNEFAASLLANNWMVRLEHTVYPTCEPVPMDSQAAAGSFTCTNTRSEDHTPSRLKWSAVLAIQS